MSATHHPARMRTICPDCLREMGVTQDIFNRSGMDASKWRITVHEDQARNLKRCTGARMIVSHNVVWDSHEEPA